MLNFTPTRPTLSLVKLLLAFTLGASTSLAFAPYSLWPLYPIAMAIALWHSQRLSPKSSFQYWLSFGFGSFATGISWVHVSIDTYGGMPFMVSAALTALLALYLACYPALTGLILAWLTQSVTRHSINKFQRKSSKTLSKIESHTLIWRNLALFPALWTLTEWLRGWILTGFPWLWAGYSQVQGPLKPLASLIGTLGISFILAMLAGALVLASAKRVLSLILLLIVVVSTVIVAASLSPLKATDEKINVALVQGNIPQSMKWEPDALWPTMLKYRELSLSHVDTDVIVWPEAAIPAPEFLVTDFLTRIDTTMQQYNGALITGIISQPQHDFYNALIVLGQETRFNDPDSLPTRQYQKHHLLPIGEFVPFEWLLRPIAPLFNLPMSSFARGNYQQANLIANGHAIAAAICYEIAFPEQVRANLQSNTELLLTVSNDAWFGQSNGPLQHMEIAQMRAVELGRPLIRATNNGVTAAVNERGDITASLPQFETGVLRTEISIVKGQTWFAKIGQQPLLLLCAFILFFGLLRRLWFGDAIGEDPLAT